MSLFAYVRCIHNSSISTVQVRYICYMFASAYHTINFGGRASRITRNCVLCNNSTIIGSTMCSTKDPIAPGTPTGASPAPGAALMRTILGGK